MHGTPSPSCLICGASTRPRFTKHLRALEVHYYECSTCHHLTASAFDSAHLYSQTDYFQSTDTGWRQRNKRILSFLSFFTRVPGIVLSRASTVIDFGCGIGQLVEDLIEAGYNGYGYEPYPNTLLESTHVYTDWAALQQEQIKPTLCTCIEVIEHLRQPGDVLTKIKQLLPQKGYLLLSTGIYHYREYNEDWYYLNPYAGHVSIFSEQSLRMLLKQHGFKTVFRVNQDVWLFRRSSSLSLLERFYSFVSQMRLTLNVRLRSSASPSHQPNALPTSSCP